MDDISTFWTIYRIMKGGGVIYDLNTSLESLEYKIQALSVK